MKQLLAPLVFVLALAFGSCQSNTSQSKSVNEDSLKTEQAYVDTTHNSQNSVDWAGEYVGTLPCADCPGIKTTIILHPDDTFLYHAEYLEKETNIQDTGKFMWHANGSIVHLTGEDLNTKYKVGENILIQLDLEGKEMDGPMAKAYYLEKITTP